jgi:hypothetical protein
MNNVIRAIRMAEMKNSVQRLKEALKQRKDSTEIKFNELKNRYLKLN